jgi:Lrp/AsnC family transcriptional regulator for asnA, asnC and gidA
MDRTELTAADVGIIRCLQGDARSSAASIAAKLRMPESTVRHRLSRLVKAGVVQFAAVTDPLKLGYQIWTIVEIQAELPKVRAVARRLATLPEVYFVGITTGGYDLLAAAVFRSNEDLLDFTLRRLPAIPGIVRTSTSSILELVKRSLTIGLPEEPARAAPGGTRRKRGRRTRS